jgi:Spy/CpxP family protein refolding chaperone
MKRMLIVAACLLGGSAIAWTAGRQERPPTPSLTPIDDVLQAVRQDLQEGRADIIRKNVNLTAEQAATFWPIYETYQREQNIIMDDQLRGIQRYIESFDSLDDAGALGLINAHLERDARMVTLRQTWLPEFRRVLGTKLAVRVMQIDRRLGLAHQMQFVAKIPLAH